MLLFLMCLVILVKWAAGLVKHIGGESAHLGSEFGT